jgi:truncated hemoglobin YjbI
VNNRTQLKGLLKKLGGEERLYTILKDFYHEMSKDILIGYFFSGKDVDLIAEKQMNFLLVAMGTRSTYEGKSPTSAHLELPPILSGHFDRRLTLLRQTLIKYEVDPKDIQIWIDFENAFREVVTQK